MKVYAHQVAGASTVLGNGPRMVEVSTDVPIVREGDVVIEIELRATTLVERGVPVAVVVNGEERVHWLVPADAEGMTASAPIRVGGS